MYKNSLLNAEKGIFEIKNILLNNEKIRKLLYYDTPDALNRITPEIDKVQNAIYTCPILESGIEDFNQNVYIMVNLRAIDYYNDTNKNNFEIIVITDLKEWSLDNNKIRPLQIANEIVKELDSRKLSMCGQLAVAQLEEFVVRKQLYGYLITFSSMDNMSVADF